MTSTDSVIEKKLPFSIQHQLQPVWCWAAVGASCANFYNQQPNWTQCRIVSECLGLQPGACCPGTGDVARQCEQTGYLVNGNHQGAFVITRIADGIVEGHMDLETLKSHLDQGRVVAFRLNIGIQGSFMGMSSFGHFVVVSGYRQAPGESDAFVLVNDPFFGDSEMYYHDFLTNYKCHGTQVEHHQITQAMVTHTFPTLPLNPA